MTAFDDHTSHAGQAAERAGILAEVQLVAELIIEVIGDRRDVVWELATIERRWQEVLDEAAGHGRTSGSNLVPDFSSSLVDGLTPGRAFDLWYDALAARVRRCATWVLQASGTDTAVRDQLVAIENRYAALLTSSADVTVSLAVVKLSRTGTPAAVPGTSNGQEGDGHGSQQLTRRAADAVAALEAMEVELLAQHPEAKEWAFHVLGETANELRDWLRWYEQRPSAS